MNRNLFIHQAVQLLVLILVICTLSSITTLCFAKDDSIPEEITRPGDYYFTIEHDGLKRMYRIHVPASYNPETPAPLLVALHGGGGNMNYQADDKKYRLISKSEQAGFIAAFPNGYSRFARGILATWNAGKCCGAARDKEIDDVGFIRKMVTNLSGKLNIDQNRIYTTGMSNGGLMSYRLACEMSDVFKAIAAVAGTDNTINCNPQAPVSILHIHAQNDTHVLFDGGLGNVFRDPALITDFTSVPATISKWVTQNKCDPTPRRILEKSDAYCEVYSPCEGNTAVQLCVTATGEHSWPGGNKARGEPASQAISANDVMWDFFNKNESE